MSPSVSYQRYAKFAIRLPAQDGAASKAEGDPSPSTPAAACHRSSIVDAELELEASPSSQ
jgi:hypothetical protein